MLAYTGQEYPLVLNKEKDGMARDFTDDDRDKNVVTSDGTRIGTIRDVNGGRATVKRDSDQGLTDKVKDLLGWGDDESNELRSEHVDSHRDDEVRLRGP